jgi:hypothetical protein
MFRLSMVIAAVASTAVAAGVAGVRAAATAVPRPAGVPLAGSAGPSTSHTPAPATVAGAHQLTVQLWLKPSPGSARRLVTVVATPRSGAFRHSPRPAAYAARSGPAGARVQAVAAWLRSRGFTHVSIDAQRGYVRATASVSKVNAAFHVTMNFYRATNRVNAGPYPLRANDRPVTLPASIAGSVLGVTGLDNDTARQPPPRLGAPAATGSRAPHRGRRAHRAGRGPAHALHPGSAADHRRHVSPRDSGTPRRQRRHGKTHLNHLPARTGARERARAAG